MSCLQTVRARVMLTSTFFVTPACLVWDSGTLLAMLGSRTPSTPPHLHPVSSITKPSLLYPRSTGQFITSPFALVHGWLLTPTTPILLICSTACAASLYITPSSSQLVVLLMPHPLLHTDQHSTLIFPSAGRTTSLSIQPLILSASTLFTWHTISSPHQWIPTSRASATSSNHFILMSERTVATTLSPECFEAARSFAPFLPPTNALSLTPS